MNLVNPLNFHLLNNIQTYRYLKSFYNLIDWNESFASVATAEIRNPIPNFNALTTVQPSVSFYKTTD